MDATESDNTDRPLKSPAKNDPVNQFSGGTINMPSENSSAITAFSPREHFDVMYHFFSEQRNPALKFIKEYDCDQHVFLCTKQYPSICIKKFLNPTSYREVEISAKMLPWEIMEVIEKDVATYPENTKFAFDLTLGTKLMFAAAYSCCQELNMRPLYLDLSKDSIIDIDESATFQVNSKLLVDDFFNLNQDNDQKLVIADKGYWSYDRSRNDPYRASLTIELWNFRTYISQDYKKISALCDISPRLRPPLNIEHAKYAFKKDANGCVEIRLDTKCWYFQSFDNLEEYLSGKWFEEYVFLLLFNKLPERLTNDMRIGLTVDLQAGYCSGKSSYQEFDVVLTNGDKLFIIECKAGRIKAEHIEKLQNITLKYGGKSAVGILASAFSITDTVLKKKADDAPNVKIASNYNLLNVLLETIK